MDEYLVLGIPVYFQNKQFVSQFFIPHGLHDLHSENKIPIFLFHQMCFGNETHIAGTLMRLIVHESMYIYVFDVIYE